MVRLKPHKDVGMSLGEQLIFGDESRSTESKCVMIMKTINTSEHSQLWVEVNICLISDLHEANQFEADNLWSRGLTFLQCINDK